jgi:hypothetical protein
MAKNRCKVHVLAALTNLFLARHLPGANLKGDWCVFLAGTVQIRREKGLKSSHLSLDRRSELGEGFSTSSRGAFDLSRGVLARASSAPQNLLYREDMVCLAHWRHELIEANIDAFYQHCMGAEAPDCWKSFGIFIERVVVRLLVMEPLFLSTKAQSQLIVTS